MPTRAARRAQGRDVERGKIKPDDLRRAGSRGDAGPSKLRVLAFATVAALVLGAGFYFAGNIFFRSADPGMNMTGNATVVAPATGSIDLRVSMDGFDPKIVKAKPGQNLTFNWWNSDGAMHLTNGVHSMVSDSMGIRYELPAESSKTISFNAPQKPGEYDYWCDSCCGGKDNPGMHAKIVVEA